MDWAKFSLTDELTVVIKKPTPDSKLGVTLSSFQDDCGPPVLQQKEVGSDLYIS